MKCYQYYEKNRSAIKDLYNKGYISSKLIFYHRIYSEWKKLPNSKGKMDRYQEIADNEKVSTRTVIAAIKKMNERM